MSTIDQSIKPSAAPSTRTQAQSWQIREVQEAICEADNHDFATDEQVKVVFEKYGVAVSDSGESKLDKILFNLNSDQYQQFTQILDAPDAANQGFARLMTTQAPWTVAAS